MIAKIKEWLFGKTPVEEETIPNPLQVRVGDTVTVDVMDHRDDRYEVRSIHRVERRGLSQPMIDYVVQKFGESDSLDTTLLRSVPRRTAFDRDKIQWQFLFLEPFFVCTWDNEAREEILKSATDVSGEFIIDAGQPSERTFWRVDDKKNPIVTTSEAYRDIDGNGVVESHEISRSKGKYWEFSRESFDEIGQKFVQYLYIDVDGDGIVYLRIGREIPAERILS